MVIINLNATLANFAMSRSRWLNYLTIKTNINGVVIFEQHK